MNQLSDNNRIGFSPKFEPFTWNIRGNLFCADRPLVMGILNATPDSFYSASRGQTDEEILRLTEKLIADGADIIDIGGFSTRPDHLSVDKDEELRRLLKALSLTKKIANDDILISVDTFRSDIARVAVEEGADIINDVSGGRYDENMFAVVAAMKVPYILMHSYIGCDVSSGQKTKDNAGNVTATVMKELAVSVRKAKEAGVIDIVVDPGFGFDKTTEMNFEILRNLPLLQEVLELPILIGLSRKSMLYKPLNATPDESLFATVAADTIALINGASIVRVHDPLPAKQTIEIISKTYNSYLNRC